MALDAVLTTGFSDGFSTGVRSLPSSWSLVAVEAASRSDWPLAALSLLGLTALVALLLAGVGAVARPAADGAARSSADRPAAPPYPARSGRRGRGGLRQGDPQLVA